MRGEVIADIDQEAAEIVLVVHWISGVRSEMRLPRRRRGQRNSTSADVIDAVRQLVLIANDDLIAGILNRNGLVTGYGNRWTRERVTSLRSHHRIPVCKPADDGIEPWLNLSKAVRLLHVAPRTLRLAAEAGEIEAIHPLQDGARATTERARQNPKYPTGSHPDQQYLFSSNYIDRWVFRCAVASPALDDDLGLAQSVEDLAVEQLIAKAGVEALDVAVLPRAAPLRRITSLAKISSFTAAARRLGGNREFLPARMRCTEQADARRVGQHPAGPVGCFARRRPERQIDDPLHGGSW